MVSVFVPNLNLIFFICPIIRQLADVKKINCFRQLADQGQNN
jgi:hypothetical protein